MRLPRRFDPGRRRPTSRCDTGDYAIVVDEAGSFVGNLSPGTQLTVPLNAGAHVYYTWSSRDLRTEAYPEFNPVSAFRVNAQPGGGYRVALLVVERDTGIGHCNRYAIVRFHPIVPGSPYSADIAEWLQTTRPLVADHDAGQADLESDPSTFRDYLALGRAAMERADARAH